MRYLGSTHLACWGRLRQAGASARSSIATSPPTTTGRLAPTLRLALLLCPGFVHAIADLKIRADRGSPGLEQVVLARLIQTGRFDRHLRRMRKICAGKRDALLTALNEHAPTFT